jgi:hypothetical protein
MGLRGAVITDDEGKPLKVNDGAERSLRWSLRLRRARQLISSSAG